MHKLNMYYDFNLFKLFSYALDCVLPRMLKQFIMEKYKLESKEVQLK